MKKKLLILVPDKYLYRKIELMLRDEYETVNSEYGRAVDLVIRDGVLNSDRVAARVLTLGDSYDLALPFSREMLISALSKSDDAPSIPDLELGDKCAYLRGEKVSLTEVEFALFSALFDAKGEFVSRDELIKRVWGEGADGGILNVYVHYLREKLEYKGEKIIISSRKNGYKIDGKYLISGGEA